MLNSQMIGYINCRPQTNKLLQSTDDSVQVLASIWRVFFVETKHRNTN